MTSERVWTSEFRGSAFVEPVKKDRPAAAHWPTKRAKKRQFSRLTDGVRHPVIVRQMEK